MRIKALSLVLGICAVISTSYANQNPLGLATDHRIKVVAYNPDDVVTVIGSHLVATAIELSPEEAILSVINGDPVAWTITVDKQTPYFLYIKPVLPASNTNMTIITNKRHYLLHMMTEPNDNPSSRTVTYLLEFKYPDEEKQALEEELLSLQQTFIGQVPSSPVTWNYNYSFYGAKDIAPIQAVDNGTFTIFKFQESSAIPAIFAVDNHCHESLVNVRTQGSFVFVQGVRRQYTLRNGEDVTTVYNDNYRAF